MSFLNIFRQVMSNGLIQPFRANLNFAGAFTVTDNPTLNALDITTTALVTPTGTGLVHVTGGTVDATANKGSAGQFLVTNAGATDTTWTNLSGDLSNTATPGQVYVTALQGIALPAPSGSLTVLTYNAGTLAWTSGGGGIDELTGDVTAGPGSGSIPATVVALQGYAVANTAPTDTYVLTWSAGSSYWYPAALPGGGITQLTGDVTAGPGSGSQAATVVKVNGATVTAAGSLTTGNVLQVSGASALTYAAVNLAGGSNYVTGALPITNLAHGTADQLIDTNHAGTAAEWFTPGGDVSFVSHNFTVAKINGSSVPAGGSLTTGNVLQVNGVSSLTYAAVNLAGGSNYVTGALPVANLAHGTAGQFLLTNAAATAPAWASISGDVSASVGTPGQLTVTALQGYAVANTAPTDTYVLTWDAGSSHWYPATSTGGITQLTGDVVAGPGSGSQSARVAAISGTNAAASDTIAVIPVTFQWDQNSHNGNDPDGNQVGMYLYQQSSNDYSAIFQAQGDLWLGGGDTHNEGGSYLISYINLGGNAAKDHQLTGNINTFISISGGLYGRNYGIGSNYTLDTSQTDYLIYVTSPGITLNLVSAAGTLHDGRIVRVISTIAAPNITFTAGGGTINGGTSYVWNSDYGIVEIVRINSAWYIIGTFDPTNIYPNLTWNLGVSSPTLTQTIQSSDVATTTMTIAAQSAYSGASGSNQNGAFLQLQGGAATLNGSQGLRGGVRLELGADSNEIMVEVTEVTGNHRVVALCQLSTGITNSNVPDGDGIIFIANDQADPSSNPSNGVLVYANSGALYGRGGSGTITTIAPAEPHCKVCGSDYVIEHQNDKWGYHAICMKCLGNQFGDVPWIVRTKAE